MRIEFSFLINATRVELPSGQTTIALEMHHLFVINNYISNLNNHILFEMEKLEIEDKKKYQLTFFDSSVIIIIDGTKKDGVT